LLPNYSATLLLNHLYRPDNPADDITGQLIQERIISPSDVHLLRPDIDIPERLPVIMTQEIQIMDDHELIQATLMGRIEEDAVWYRMKKRESLMAIARRKNLSFDRLVELNSGWDKDLNPGSLIRIK
jgi:hypothetical protein